jgi:hypothetical protein
MNKYILGDTIMPTLKKEMNLVDYPVPEEVRVMEGEHPAFGKVFQRTSRYKADKIKRISEVRHDVGGTLVGTVILIMCEDNYDFPFIMANIAFAPGEGGKDKMFVEINYMPFIKDEESTRKYIDPLRGWREAIDKLPSEPISGLGGEPGEFIRDSISPFQYLRFVPVDYLDQVIDLTKQFFEIFLDFWRKAEPIKDIQRREKIAAFRREYNRHILEEDPSGRASIEAFGKEKALLSFENTVFL